MRKQIGQLAANLSLFAFIIIIFGNIVIVAQTAVSGEWTSKPDSKSKASDDSLHLSFVVNTSNSGRNQHGSNFDLADLRGLTREQTQNGNVRFSIIREAGTVECEGSFVNGRGSGTFRFTADAGYISAMRSRGFDFEKYESKGNKSVESRLLSAALINVTTALADDLKSSGFGELDVDDLFKAAIFKVDSQFMAEMKATGFPDLTMEDLVKARIFKIDAEYVRQVHQMGFSDKGFETLVKFRIFKVTPEFLGELNAAGLKDLDSEDIVKCRIFKIDPEFVRKAKIENPNVTVEELVKMRIFSKHRSSGI